MSSTASDGTPHMEDQSSCGDTARCHDETNPCECITDLTQMALDDLHPDPKVQAALWCIFHQSPGLLETRAYVTLAISVGIRGDDLLDRLRDRRTTP